MSDHADVIGALTDAALARFKADLRTVLVALRSHFRALLDRAHTDKGGLAEDSYNRELAAKLEAGFSRILTDAGYDGAIGRLLDSFEKVAEANGTFLEDRLRESYSGASARSLGRLASGTVDDLLLRGKEAGATLREILVTGAHTNAPLDRLLAELSERAEITFRQAVTEAETQLLAFHRDGLVTESYDAGIDLYVYDGPDDGIIRDFCSLYVGKIVTVPDLDEASNPGQPRPISRFLGGYRCRHSLSPISVEEARDMVSSEGEKAIGPGCRLARKIVLQGKEGPAARAWRERNVGEVVNGRVVRA